MAQGSQSKLRQELDAMLRQRDQYSLALDTATDPQAAIRLQRTLDRLEDEIEGMQEALQAMPADPPDWEDEPATAIFDPGDDMLPPEPPPRPRPAAAPPASPVDEDEPMTVPVEPIPSDFRKPSEIPTDVGHGARDEPTEHKPSQVVTVPGAPNPLIPDHAEPSRPETTLPSDWGPETGPFGLTPSSDAEPSAETTEVAPASGPPEPGVAHEVARPDPTPAVTAPPVPRADIEPPTEPMPRSPSVVSSAPTPMQQTPPAGAQLRESSRALPDPLGPVVLDALEPPTGEIPKEPDVPTIPLSFPPGQQPIGTDVDSPFGPGAAASFDISTEPPPEQSWSAAGKILLALVVAAFLTAVFWVLSQ